MSVLQAQVIESLNGLSDENLSFLLDFFNIIWEKVVVPIRGLDWQRVKWG